MNGVATFSDVTLDTAGTYTLQATASGLMPATTAPFDIEYLEDNGPQTDTPGNVLLGEPIDINTGNVYQSVVDYSTAGSNPFSFTRYYNTYTPANDAATTLGERWRSTYDRYLYFNSPTSVTAEQATGQVLNFTLVGAVWQTDSDMDYTLTHSGSTWTLTDPEDNVETYTDNGSGLGLLATIRARSTAIRRRCNTTRATSLPRSPIRSAGR